MTLDCWCVGPLYAMPDWLFYNVSGISIWLWEATGLLIGPEVLLPMLVVAAALFGVALPLAVARMLSARRLAQLEFQRLVALTEIEREEASRHGPGR